MTVIRLLYLYKDFTIPVRGLINEDMNLAYGQINQTSTFWTYKSVFSHFYYFFFVKVCSAKDALNLLATWGHNTS